jgi:hypothetical protein
MGDQPADNDQGKGNGAGRDEPGMPSRPCPELYCFAYLKAIAI